MSHLSSSPQGPSVSGPATSMVAAVRASKPIVRGVARRAMAGRNRSRSDPAAGRFTRSQINRIVTGAFSRFERQVPDLPCEPTLGSRQNVILAALTLSFLEALEADGIERDHAIELAEMWGGTLERSGTLVAGASCCDFRLRVPANAEAPSGATPRPALPMVAAWFPAQTSGEPSY